MCQKCFKQPPNGYPVTRDEWLRRWRHDFVHTDKMARHLLLDWQSFHKLWDTLVGYSAIENIELHTLSSMAVSHVLSAVRTLVDTDKRARSLRNLLNEISNHSSLLTEAWFKRAYLKGRQTEWGERDFRRNFGKSGKLTPGRVRRDLKLLDRECGRIKKFVDKRIAHYDRRGPRFKLEWGEIDKAIRSIIEVSQRYELLLNQRQTIPLEHYGRRSH